MPTPPTIFCLIREVSPAYTPQGWGFTVTVADQEGTTVTLMLQADDLVTYERFQAAVRRETDGHFHYRPWESHGGQAGQSQPAAP
jgi:hypothetical protein